MYKAMGETPEGRKWLERADKRINEYMEEKHDEKTQEQAKRARLETSVTEDPTATARPETVVPRTSGLRLQAAEVKVAARTALRMKTNETRRREVQPRRERRWKSCQKECR